MANNWYLVDTLTGGTAGALDALDGNALNDGDRAIAIISGQAAFYVLDADNAGAENEPYLISPDTNPGDKRWVLKTVDVWGVTTADKPTNLPNIIDSTNSISSGNYCNILGSDFAAVLFGENNIISESDYSTCAGSANEIWDGYENVIGGGYNNIISGGGEESCIVGGYENRLIGAVSVIAGGDRNIVDADKAAILGGKRGRAYLDYQEAFAADYFAVEGDAQRSTLTVKTSTTSATVATMSTLFKPMGNRLWKFDIHLAAMQSAGTSGTVGDSAFWTITGGIKTTGGVNSSGAMTFSGNPVAGETFNFNGKTFTFVNKTEFLESKEIPYLDAKYYAADVINREFKQYFAEYDYVNTITITSLLTTSTDNNVTFTESATNLSLNGSGKLGGTTAGVSPTAAIVGTVQGAGVPGANNRDSGAAAWSVAVTADNTDKYLKIAVTGEADKTIRWVAKVDLVEVGI